MNTTKTTKPTTLHDYTKQVEALVDGQTIFLTPRYAMVRAKNGRDIFLAGPAERGWRRTNRAILAHLATPAAAAE